jgi:hypothetical protein
LGFASGLHFLKNTKRYTVTDVNKFKLIFYDKNNEHYINGRRLLTGVEQEDVFSLHRFDVSVCPVLV